MDPFSKKREQDDVGKEDTQVKKKAHPLAGQMLSKNFKEVKGKGIVQRNLRLDEDEKKREAAEL